jgi:hypothetical protein
MPRDIAPENPRVYEVWLWVPTKGWKKVAAFSGPGAKEEAIAEEYTLYPLETKVVYPEKVSSKGMEYRPVTFAGTLHTGSYNAEWEGHEGYTKGGQPKNKPVPQQP